MDSSLLSTPNPDPRDQKKFYFADTSQRRALVGSARFLFRFIMDLQVSGLEYLPRDGAVIIAANHVTNFDAFVMQLALPRPLFFMAKTDLFKNPFLDLIIRSLGGFPVHRGEKDLWAMRHAAVVLNHGQALAMFPEGKPSGGRGLSVAKTGTARLAIEAQCPIIPMTLTGSNQLFKRFLYRAPIHIQVLPALMPKPNETPLALTDRLMFTLAQALPAEMRGVYAEMPKGFAMQK